MEFLIFTSLLILSGVTTLGASSSLPKIPPNASRLAKKIIQQKRIFLIGLLQILVAIFTLFLFFFEESGIARKLLYCGAASYSTTSLIFVHKYQGGSAPIAITNGLAIIHFFSILAIIGALIIACFNLLAL